VPFTVMPKRVDKELAAKLRQGARAILAWMVEGCLAWQRDGLNPPAVVRATTEEYFRDEDAVGQWLDEECEHTPDAFTETEELFASWRVRCGRLGEPALTKKQLAQTLANRGCRRGNHPRSRHSGFHGVRLRNSTAMPVE